jgi:putative ABC transport system permease protein
VTRLAAYAVEALEAIWRNRVRSALTMLGMIIGTASIIGVLGISRAASNGIKATLGSFGDQGVVVSVDDNGDDPQRAAIQYQDVAQVEAATAGLVRWVTPSYNGSYELRANGIKYITAVSSQTDKVTDTLTLHEGRRMTAADVRGAAHVALISQDLAERFFGTGPVAGQFVRVNGTRFEVIGVYDHFKASLLSTIAGQDYIEIPYTVFHQIRPGPVDFIQIFPYPGVAASAASDATTAVLRHLHGARAQYVVQDTAAQFEAFDTTLALIATGLTAIGGVALVVAGIGIMNIMLVSVTERTREIGLRKSIGASAGDITLQFLLEAIVLSLLGGAIGSILGLSATIAGYAVLSRIVGPAPIPYLLIVSVAVGFSTFVGTVFGTYPAIRAGRLDPIEALRA